MAAGMEGKEYAGHSLWIGTATIQVGLQDSLVGECGLYTLCVQTPRETLCVVAEMLARKGVQGRN